MIDENLKYVLGLRSVLYRRSERRIKISNITLLVLYLFSNLGFCAVMLTNDFIGLIMSLLTFVNLLLLGFITAQDHMFENIINIHHVIPFPVSKRWYYSYILLSHIRSAKFIIAIVPLFFMAFKFRLFGFSVNAIACVLYFLFVLFVIQLVSSLSIIFYKYSNKIAPIIFYAAIILFPIQNKIAGNSKDINDYIIFNAPVIGWVGKGIDSAMEGDISRPVYYITYMAASCILLYLITPRIFNKMEL